MTLATSSQQDLMRTSRFHLFPHTCQCSSTEAAHSLPKPDHAHWTHSTSIANLELIPHLSAALAQGRNILLVDRPSPQKLPPCSGLCILHPSHASTFASIAFQFNFLLSYTTSHSNSHFTIHHFNQIPQPLLPTSRKKTSPYRTINQSKAQP